ncbi:MAG: SGNH/GDSL hydrolase family protein, partial [Planctomycetes bacterium]|nr:SGNH/GDSL hydrolase family protein [Planctomycetota bacterium]
IQRFGLKDGDRVVFLGSTFIERMQVHGYLETLLTISHPQLDIRFRNLGWSGDDVWGTSRALFGTQADGFKRLRKDLIETKPTVVIVSYGANEAQAGVHGIPKFVAGLNNLLDAIEPTGARIVLLAPPRRENLGSPLPDPSHYNRNLATYNKSLRTLAAKRQLHFINFYRPLGTMSRPDDAPPSIRNRLTDNGLHFNNYGYWRAAPNLALAFRDIPKWRVDIRCEDGSAETSGTRLSELRAKKTGVQFSALDVQLPYSQPPKHAPRGAKLVAPHAVLRVRGLVPGEYGLRIDGKPTILADHEQWATGVPLNLAQYDGQVDQLRRTIREKNALFFHRHRPQNETYLFLFRKHEQGNNATEIPQFDPLITEKEKQIATLRKPRTKSFQLVKLETSNPKDQ